MIVRLPALTLGRQAPQGALIGLSLSESGAQGLETRWGRCEAEKGGEA